MRPAFDSTSELPLPLDPKKLVLVGGVKKASGATPKTPALPKAASTPWQKEKRKAPLAIPAKKASTAEKQMGVLPDPPLPLQKRRKTTSASGITINEPVPKDQTTLIVSSTPSSVQLEVESTPGSRVIVPVPSHTDAQAHHPVDTSEPPLEDFEKYLKEVIPEQERELGTVWRTHLPENYPDSLGIHLPGFTGMQRDLAPSVSDRSRYAREAFRVTSTAEERKLIEEDPQGALDALVYYLHHSGVISGALKDKYEKESLRLEATSPIVPQSKAAIIERDFFKSQMEAKNRIANLRGLKIEGYRKDMSRMKGTIQRQQAALVGTEAELAEAKARVAEVEKELAAHTRQLEKQKEENEQQKEELPRATIVNFLASNAFTEAATISCKNLMKASIYKELKKLSKIYPFDPQYCGFVEIPDNKNVAVPLPGYTWDTEKDRLRTPKGKKVHLPVKLESVTPEVIPFRWESYMLWPVDVNDPFAGWIPEQAGEEEGEEEIDGNPTEEDLNPQAEDDPNPPIEEDLVNPPRETEVPTAEPEAETIPSAAEEEPVVNAEDRVEERTSPTPPYSPLKAD